MTRVVFTRGELDESEHEVAWCATAAGGELIACNPPGAAGLGVFGRSAFKPLQALPSARDGVLERFGLGDRHLAVACASHGGTADHIELVHELLAACGLTEAALACGPLEPRDPGAAGELRTTGVLPTAVTHNCSGKHALGLALCQASGWPVEGYQRAAHPLQAAMRAAVAEASGCGDVPYGIDGCGMLAFRIPLARLAAAFGRLAAGELGAPGDLIAQAMRANPALVAYEGALDTELMRAEDGLVAKIGAEGVLAVGLPDGRGLALKVLDGAMRAVDPAGVALVRELLGRPATGAALDALARPAISNSRGEIVGAGEARL